MTIAYASTYEIVGSDNVKLMSSIILSYVQHLPKLVQDLVTKHIIGKDTLHNDLYITYFSVVSPFNEYYRMGHPSLNVGKKLCS